MDSHEPEAERLPTRKRGHQELRQDAEWALKRALDAGDVLPLLHRLARTAPAGSEESLFAHRQLAELVAERHPWRAALYARRVIAFRPEDERAWAILALCQTMLGHYRCAVSAYRHALAAAPKNPWYAHNLGHLLDVALERPAEALVWLRVAYALAGWSAEISLSFAHALARCGELDEAKVVLAKAMEAGATREQAALMAWLEAGAPAEKEWAPRSSSTRATLAGGRTRSDRPSSSSADTDRDADLAADALATANAHDDAEADAADEIPKRERTAPPPPRNRLALPLERALARGLTHLPLDAKQRRHAVALAQDAQDVLSDPRADEAAAALPEVRERVDSRSASTLAAAVAYGIVYVDRIPLTQAEVAACFRVSVSSVRGRFGELRAQLDLTPGDVRYRSARDL